MQPWTKHVLNEQQEPEQTINGGMMNAKKVRKTLNNLKGKYGEDEKQNLTMMN